MANTVRLKEYEIISPLKNSEKYAFSFVKNEEMINARSDAKSNYLEKMGGSIDGFWVFFSIAAIIGAIGLGVMEANVAKATISALIDPMGEGTIPPRVIAFVGISLAIIGMLIGHLIFDFIKVNEYTGKRDIHAKFYVSIVAALFYVALQFYFAKTAGHTDDTTEMSISVSFHAVPYVVAGIALLEIIVGALFLNKAMTYIIIYILAISIWSATKKLNRNARSCNNSYRDYQTLLSVWNTQNTGNIKETEGSLNIKKAILYYQNNDSNTDNSGDNSSATMTEKDNTPKSDSASNAGKPQSKKTKEATIENEMDDFMDDDTDDNLNL